MDDLERRVLDGEEQQKPDWKQWLPLVGIGFILYDKRHGRLTILDSSDPPKITCTDFYIGMSNFLPWIHVGYTGLSYVFDFPNIPKMYPF